MDWLETQLLLNQIKELVEEVKSPWWIEWMPVLAAVIGGVLTVLAALGAAILAMRNSHRLKKIELKERYYDKYLTNVYMYIDAYVDVYRYFYLINKNEKSDLDQEKKEKRKKFLNSKKLLKINDLRLARFQYQASRSLLAIVGSIKIIELDNKLYMAINEIFKEKKKNIEKGVSYLLISKILHRVCLPMIFSIKEDLGYDNEKTGSPI